MKIFLPIIVLFFTFNALAQRDFVKNRFRSSVGPLDYSVQTFTVVGNQTPGAPINNISKVKWQNNASRGIDSCGVDTVEYLSAKNTVLEWYYLSDTVFNNGGNQHDNYSGYAQYFDAPQTLNVHGANFYGYLFTAGDSALVTVSMYSATTDSFPDQLITQKDIWVHDDFNALNLNVMKQVVTFDSVITTNQPYLIAIETNTKKELLVLSNSFTNLDGNGEGLGFAFYSHPSFPSFHGWYDQVNFTANWDFDWILEPQVSYSHQITLILDTNSLCQNDSLCAVIDASPIIKHRMYNQDGSNWDNALVIDWGDGSSVSGDSACYIYAASGIYTINAQIAINSWSGMSCTSSDMLSVTVDPTPMADFSYIDNIGGNVSFTDLSTNADSILWDLGNGLTTTDSAFVYTYVPADSTYLVTLVAYGTCTNDTATMSISPTPLSISEPNLTDLFKVYPNPTSGLVSINISKQIPYNIEVLDVLGKTIYNTQANGSTQLNLEGHSKGIYFVQLKALNKVLTKKILLVD